MLGRIASAVALASMAALVLVGCTPDPEPTDEEVAAEISETVAGFFGAVDSLYAAGAADASVLEAYATPELAATWASDVQAVIDSDVTTNGTPVITNATLISREESAVTAAICTDLSDVETTLADGSTAEGEDLVAWEARLVSAQPEAPFVLSSLDPIADPSACGS